MQGYSPFLSYNGQIKSLNKITYSDLQKLSENGIEEGFSVEYKSKWDSNFKTKNLCQTITSFANSDGGWLFVGINDDASILEISKERSDFSQTIAQLLCTHTSPIPKFECRFIKKEKSSDTGVLVIYIPKGENSPYVCKGKVYIRSGSSKLPITSGRAEIDNLYKRREKLNEYIKEFCNCADTHGDVEYPYLAFYFFRDDISPNMLSYEKMLKLCRINIPNIQRINHCINSVLFYNTNVVGETQSTPVVELFDNGFAKAIIPLIGATNIDNEILKKLIDKNKNIYLNGLLAINAELSLISIPTMLDVAFKILEKAGMDPTAYNYCYEFKNIKNTFLYFPNAKFEYLNFIENDNFRMSPKPTQKSYTYKLGNYKRWKSHIKITRSFALQTLCDSFGYCFEDIKALYLKSLDTQNYHETDKAISVSPGGRIVC